MDRMLQSLYSYLDIYLPSWYVNVSVRCECRCIVYHDDLIKWKHFLRYWPFARGIHRSPVNSPPKGQWRGASMFSLICVWINGWVNNREAGDLRRYHSYYDVIVMSSNIWVTVPVVSFFHRIRLSTKCMLPISTTAWRKIIYTISS